MNDLSNMSRGLRDALSGAKHTILDEERNVWLAWHGGHGIHAYAMDGKEIGFWNCGDFRNDHATLEEVSQSMLEVLRDPERDQMY